MKRLVLRPGVLRPIDVPFARLGGIEGQLSGMKNGTVYRISIKDLHGNTVASRTADRDGSFIFDGIKYGDYRLEITNGGDNIVNKLDITINRNFQSITSPLAVS
jgi:hypothetical protein